MSEHRTAQEALCYFTECQLATVEDLRDRKRFPRGELQRHERIAELMILSVRAYCKPEDYHRHCSRLRDIVAPQPPDRVA